MFAHFEQIKDPVRAGAKLQRCSPASEEGVVSGYDPGEFSYETGAAQSCV